AAHGPPSFSRVAATARLVRFSSIVKTARRLRAPIWTVASRMGQRARAAILITREHKGVSRREKSRTEGMEVARSVGERPVPPGPRGLVSHAKGERRESSEGGQDARHWRACLRHPRFDRSGGVGGSSADAGSTSLLFASFTRNRRQLLP